MCNFYRLKLLTNKEYFNDGHRQDCIDNNLISIGWQIIDSTNVSSIDEYKKQIEKENENMNLNKSEKQKRLNKFNYAYERFVELTDGDYVWIQKDSRTYYLGKIEGKPQVDKKRICEIGLVRKCIWKKISYDEIPGAVLGYFSGRGRTIERCTNLINNNERIKKYCSKLYDIDIKIKLDESDFKYMLHDDDLEDLLGLYLQLGYDKAKNIKIKYYIHPSTNKKSTKSIEFELRSNTGEKAGIQCKTGNDIVEEKTLDEFTNNGYKIFVSTVEDEMKFANPNIIRIKMDELYKFAQNNRAILPARINKYLDIIDENKNN